MPPLDSSRAHGSFQEDLGIWAWVAAEPLVKAGPALFLDRDGVIVEDPGYLSRVADLALIPGAADLIASANRRGIPVVEITNQAGIGRGYYGWKEFLEVQQALARELAAGGAVIDAVLACPYHADGIPPWGHPAHPARKPGPGMLLAAERLLNLDLKRSWIVGDKLDDLLAGYNAGLYGGLHVLTGQGPAHRKLALDWNPKNFEVRFADSIRDAAALAGMLG
jgi:D-glycero-D-manno-heptose 1,7-bisphosphate phosphatase